MPQRAGSGREREGAQHKVREHPKPGYKGLDAHCHSEEAGIAHEGEKRICERS